jgi:DNA-binding IclR family transcriptional regulator
MPVFRSQHQAELLMWLLLHPDREYGVSDLAERLGVPLSTLHREVVRLGEAGLIASRTLGRNRLVRANTEHPAAGPLTSYWSSPSAPKW